MRRDKHTKVFVLFRPVKSVPEVAESTSIEPSDVENQLLKRSRASQDEQFIGKKSEIGQESQSTGPIPLNWKPESSQDFPNLLSIEAII
jgi:hypothetical protein